MQRQERLQTFCCLALPRDGIAHGHKDRFPPVAALRGFIKKPGHTPICSPGNSNPEKLCRYPVLSNAHRLHRTKSDAALPIVRSVLYPFSEDGIRVDRIDSRHVRDHCGNKRGKRQRRLKALTTFRGVKPRTIPGTAFRGRRSPGNGPAIVTAIGTAAGHSASPCSKPWSKEVPLDSNFTMPTYERAVQLFQEWGFRVEEGPGQDEVTLILEGPGYRTYCVYEIPRLPHIAAVALLVRGNEEAKQASPPSLPRAHENGPYAEPRHVLN